MWIMSLQARYEEVESESELVCYLPEYIPHVWAEVHPFIGTALERGSIYNRTQIFDGLIDSTMQLWTSQRDGEIEACLVTKIEEDYCLLLACAGENMQEWGKYFTILEDWAKSNGCKSLRIHGRVGWAKAFGFEIEYAVMRRDL
jgi:hypothetical protein